MVTTTHLIAHAVLEAFITPVSDRQANKGFHSHF